MKLKIVQGAMVEKVTQIHLKIVSNVGKDSVLTACGPEW